MTNATMYSLTKHVKFMTKYFRIIQHDILPLTQNTFAAFAMAATSIKWGFPPRRHSLGGDTGLTHTRTDVAEQIHTERDVAAATAAAADSFTNTRCYPRAHRGPWQKLSLRLLDTNCCRRFPCRDGTKTDFSDEMSEWQKKICTTIKYSDSAISGSTEYPQRHAWLL